MTEPELYYRDHPGSPYWEDIEEEEVEEITVSADNYQAVKNVTKLISCSINILSEIENTERLMQQLKEVQNILLDSQSQYENSKSTRR